MPEHLFAGDLLHRLPRHRGEADGPGVSRGLLGVMFPFASRRGLCPTATTSLYAFWCAVSNQSWEQRKAGSLASPPCWGSGQGCRSAPVTARSQASVSLSDCRTHLSGLICSRSLELLEFPAARGLGSSLAPWRSMWLPVSAQKACGPSAWLCASAPPLRRALAALLSGEQRRARRRAWFHENRW